MSFWQKYRHWLLWKLSNWKLSVQPVMKIAPKQQHSPFHYSDVITGAMASQITGASIVYSTVCSGVDQRKHQSSASLAFVRGIHGWPVNPPSQRASNAENVSTWWRHHVSVTYHSTRGSGLQTLTVASNVASSVSMMSWSAGFFRKRGFSFLTATRSEHIDGLVQDCSNSSTSAMESLQSCTKPSI